MPNRHKLPTSFRAEQPKFPYYQKPNWLELKQQERKQVVPPKKKTVNDVKVDPYEVRAIYQLIDDTKERMKQIKEGVSLGGLPKTIGRLPPKKPEQALLNKTEDNIVVDSHMP